MFHCLVKVEVVYALDDGAHGLCELAARQLRFKLSSQIARLTIVVLEQGLKPIKR